MADLTFSAILSKYASSGSASPAPAPVPRPTPSARPPTQPPQPQSRTTAVGQSRSFISTSSVTSINSRLSSTSISSASSTVSSSRPFSNGSSTRPESGAPIKKRKIDSPVESLPLTEADKERERRRKLLLEKLKKREKEASTKAGSAPPPKGALQPTAKPSAPVSRDRPSSASAPPAGNTEILSYKQRLERAAKQQDEKKNLGIITHKARAPVVEKKEWQKKLEAQKARQQLPKGSVAVDRKSKSPGVISANERTALTAKKPLGKDAAKSNLAKKPEPDGRRSSITKGKPLDKGKPGELIKRKRSPSPISWRGKNASAITTKKPSRPKHGRSKYDDDDDDDDSWIVDDDDEEDSGRGRQSSYSRKYRYAESDYDSGSDMEAAGLDILEEEERSRRTALKEDLAQEKLEKQKKLDKEKRKKMLVKK